LRSAGYSQDRGRASLERGQALPLQLVGGRLAVPLKRGPPAAASPRLFDARGHPAPEPVGLRLVANKLSTTLWWLPSCSFVAPQDSEYKIDCDRIVIREGLAVGAGEVVPHRGVLGA